MAKDIQFYIDRLTTSPEDMEALGLLQEECVRQQRLDLLVQYYESRTSALDEVLAVQEWLGLAERLEELAATVAEPELKAGVLYLAGELWHKKVGQPDRAMVMFQQAFRTWTGLTQALDAARAIYHEQGNYRMVSRLYELQAQVTEDPAQRAELLFEAGRVQLDFVEDREAAADYFQKALELAPGEPRYARALDLAQETDVQWIKLATRFEEEAAASSDDALSCSLYVRAAQTILDNGGDPGEALRLANLALLRVPDDPRATAIVEGIHSGTLLGSTVPEMAELHDDDEGSDTPTTQLKAVEAPKQEEEQPKQEEEQPEAPVQAVEEHRPGPITPDEEAMIQELDKARTKEHKAGILKRLAQLRVKADDPVAAAEHLSKALELLPTDRELLAMAEAVFPDAGRLHDLAKLMEAALRRMRRGSGETEFVRKIARLYWHDLGDMEAAEKLWRRIKLSSPRDPEMLGFYAKLYEQSGDYKRLLSVLANLQSVQKDREEKILTGKRMAEIAEHELENYEKAIDVWKGIGRIAPDLDEVRESLKRLFRLTGKWNALLEFYKQEIAALPKDEVERKVALYKEMLTIYQDNLHLDVMVINTYNAILQIDPGNREALDELCVRYEKASRWNDLIGVLKRKAELVEDQAERIELLRRIAELYLERFNNQAQAVKPLEAILEMDPGNRDALATLRKIYQHRRDWRNLLRVVVAEAEVAEGDEKAAILEEAANLAQQRLKKTDQAIELWKRRLDLADSTLPASAVEALDKLYTKTRRHEDLAELLETQLARLPDDHPERYAILCRLGRLLVKPLGRTDRAIETWRAALAIAPSGDDEPQRALEQLYVSSKDWASLEGLLLDAGQPERLSEILLTSARVEKDPAVRAELWRRVVHIGEEHLDDPELVLKAREALLDLDPEDMDVVRALAQAYRVRRDWRKLAAMLESLLGHEEDQVTRRQLYGELWGILEDRLADPSAAFKWCGKAFEEFPGPDVEQELVRLAERTDAWESFVVIGREVARTLEDPDYQLALYLTLGGVCKDELGWQEEAIDYYNKALVEDTENREALDALDELYQAARRWRDLLSVLDRKAEIARDQEERYEIGLRIAKLQEDFLDNPKEAVAAYNALLDLDAGSVDALEGLVRLYTRTEDWPRLAETIQRLVELAEDPEARASYLFHLGQVHEVHLGDEHRAVDLYAELLEIVPGHDEAVTRLEGLLAAKVDEVRVARLLEPVYRERTDWRRLADVLDVLQAEQDDPLSRVSMLKEIAHLAEDRLKDQARAFERLLAAFELMPDDRSLWEELDRLAGELDQWEPLARGFSDAVEASDRLDDTDRLELALRVGEIRERQDRPEDAVAAYQRALDLDPESMEAVEALERLHTKLEQWAELIQVLERKVTLVQDTSTRCAILQQVCDLQETAIQAPSDAIQTYLRIIDLDPGILDAWHALERLYTDSHQYAELADILVRLIEVQGTSDEGIEARHRLGLVRERYLGDPVAALESYREVLELTPKQESIERLEALLAEQPQGLVAPERFVRTITEILEPVYQEAGTNQDLIRILGRRLQVSDDAHEQVELLSRISELHQRSGDLDAAFDSMADAARVAPYREDVVRSLEALSEALDRWQDMVAALERAIDAAGDPGVKIQLLKLASRVATERLGDLPMAEAFLRRVLDIDPVDEGALDDLETCLRKQSKHQAVVEVLRRKADLQDDPEARVALLHQLAEVQDAALAHPGDAIETYREILTTDDREPKALDELERLLESEERWQDLIGLLEHRVDISEDLDTRKILWARIGTIYDERLEDADQAIEAWRSIHEQDPADRGALAELDRLYEREERWPELLDVLERRVELSPEPEERATLQLRQGHLLADRLGDTVRAIECFREVLEGDPGNEGARLALESILDDPEHRSMAAEVLEPFYTALQSWEPLRRSMEIRLLDMDDPVTRLELLLRIARLCEDRLSDPDAAFDALARAFKEVNSDPRPIDGMHRLAAVLDRWTDLVDILEAEAADEMDAVVAKDLRLKAARILHHEVGDLDKAQAAYRKVLDLDPEDPEALDALESIYRALARYQELLGILSTKVQVSDDDSLRIELLMQMAQVQRDVLEEPEGAINSLRQVLALDSEHPEANLALTEILIAQERWADLADHYIQQLTLAQPPADPVGIKFELGRVYKHHLDNPGGAIEAFKEVLEESPGHDQAISELQDYLEAGVDVPAVADILEPIYTEQGDWKRVVQVIRARRDAEDDPVRRSELALQMAGIHERRLNDPDAAFAVLAEALRQNPDGTELRVELERMADKVGGWMELVELFEDLVDQVGDPDAAVAMRRSLAGASEERINDYQRARKHWEIVFEQEESDLEAVESLERIFTRTEQWESLVDLYVKQVERTLDVGEKISILGKVCNLYEEVLDRPDEAVEVYRRILDLDPEHEQAIRGLDRLLTGMERWEDLAGLLQHQVDVTTDRAEELTIRHRLADLLFEKLGRVGDALDVFRAILADEPGYPPAIESMETILVHLGFEDDDDHASGYRQQLVELLEPHYESTADWPKLIGLYEIRFHDSLDVFDKVQILKDVARIQEERMNEPARAFITLAEAMGIDFGNEELADELDRLADSLGAWEKLVNVYVDGLENVEDPEVAVRMLLRLATIFDHKLRHGPNAVECYRRLLTLQPGHRESLDALERLYGQAGSHEQLVEILTEKAARTDDMLEKKDLYYRICEIWDEVLSDVDKAIESYRVLLEIDPEDLVAIEALERLYRASSRWEELVEIYRRKVELSPDPSDQIEALFEIAKLEDERLSNPDEAIQACRQVLDLDPVNPTAFGMLQALFKREQRWIDLLDLLEQALGIANTTKAMDAIQMQIGELQMHQLDSPEDAIETFRSILDRTPGHGEAIAALERLMELPEHREAAALVLEPQYETAGNWAALVRILGVRKEATDDPITRVDLLKRMARIHEMELNDPSAAFECLGTAYLEDPYEGLSELERLTEILDDRPRLAGLLESVLARTDDPQVRLEVSRRLARLYDHEMGRGKDAVPYYRALLGFDELDTEALEALDRIYTSLEDFEHLEEILERRVDVASRDEVPGLRFRLGQLLEQFFDDLERALDQYRQILWEEPGHVDARAALDAISENHPELRIQVQEVLEPIFWDEEAYDGLVVLYQRRLELAGDPVEKAELYMKIGDLLENKLQDRRGAFESYRAALELDFGDGMALENLRRLVEPLGAWAELAEAMAGVLDRVDDPDVVAEVGLELARIYREHLGNDQEAERLYLAALERDPQDTGVLDRLEGIYRDTNQPAKLVEVLERKAALEMDVGAMIQLLREAALLSEDVLEDPGRAEKSYRAILEADEGDGEALLALQRLVEARGDREELVAVIEQRIASSMDTAELLELHRKLAELFLELGRPEDAIERLRTCLDMDPTSKELLARLQGLYEQAGQWDEVKDVLIQRMSLAEDDDSRVEILMALAGLAEERLDDPEEAEGYVRQVLEIRPGDKDVRSTLERLLTRLERWWDLVDLYRDWAREAPDDEARIDLLLQVVDVAQDRLQETSLVRETLEQVMELDPDHPRALDGLVDMYEADGEWDKCLEILERQIVAGGADSDRLAQLNYRKAKILFEHLERTNEAIEALLRALEQAPTHQGTMELLKEVYRREEDWRSYAQMLSFQVRLTKDPEERFELLKEQASVLRERLDDPEAAVDALEQANDIEPGDPEITRPLVDAYLAAGKWDKAKPLLEDLVASLRKARKFRELPRLLHRMGLVAQQLGDEEGALEHFKASHDIDATYLPNLISLGKAYYAREDWQAALKVFQTMLLHQSEMKSVADRVDLFYHLGKVRLALGDKRRAKDMFSRALSLDRDHAPSKEGLEQAKA